MQWLGTAWNILKSAAMKLLMSSSFAVFESDDSASVAWSSDWHGTSPRARGKFQARISAYAVRDAFYFFGLSARPCLYGLSAVRIACTHADVTIMTSWYVTVASTTEPEARV